jgi:hypothetical protein
MQVDLCMSDYESLAGCGDEAGNGKMQRMSLHLLLV